MLLLKMKTSLVSIFSALDNRFGFAKYSSKYTIISLKKMDGNTIKVYCKAPMTLLKNIIFLNEYKPVFTLTNVGTKMFYVVIELLRVKMKYKI